MELHIAGRVYNGVEAARAGLVNQAFAISELDKKVGEIAERIASAPPAVVSVNKRYVHSALEARGTRSSIRVAADLQAGPHMQALMGMTDQLSEKIKEKGKP